MISWHARFEQEGKTPIHIPACPYSSEEADVYYSCEDRNQMIRVVEKHLEHFKPKNCKVFVYPIDSTDGVDLVADEIADTIPYQIVAEDSL